ncbi:hypothetical protein FHX74_001655 [Friedmanniella endophytica]|uniref:Uncharacterized protein n=1 Tax=Microlunatus kandeliicorticis TaxID=1759536 RepID=A0A7W3IRX5_9ACTN|nr:hypothetical protein [Microlunatus kandeliicorticis]MBA8794050.1 hypothetical protein [Microlunatus kandeliicorticis]
MFGFRRPRETWEDPAVPLVEALLTAAVQAEGGPERLPLGQVPAEMALWICSCITVDDSPTWLIYTTSDDKLVWRRVADGVNVFDEVVVPRREAGGHADPADVLDWLRGESLTPWGSLGSGWTDEGVVDVLGERIRSSAP